MPRRGIVIGPVVNLVREVRGARREVERALPRTKIVIGTQIESFYQEGYSLCNRL
jgi:hypothetical protein